MKRIERFIVRENITHAEMKEVLPFINNSMEGEESLMELRGMLLKNSRALLRLFQQRRRIARSLGELKRSLDLEIRDIKQEERVMTKLDVRDPMDERFMNAVFELTIMSENPCEITASDSLKNQDEMLQEILAEFFCLPGDMLLTNSGDGVPFIRKAVERGVHLVNDGCDNLDLHITVTRGDHDSNVSIHSFSPKNVSVSEKAVCPRMIRLDVID